MFIMIANMALIYFYDATELDKKQLTEGLEGTDHNWEFVEDKISLENCNPDAEVVSLFVSSTLNRKMIEAMPKLKLVACRSTGFNNVDFEAAEEHGVTVVNVPTYGNETVAEFAFTMLLALTRKLPAILLAEHTRFTPEELTGIDLKDKTFGVIGTGNIGQKSLKIAKGFSMRTIAHDPYPKDGLDDELGFEYVDLDELLEQSDVISLHVPYLPSTHHLMNESRLAKMKQGAILVNTARGELVDTQALIKFLDNGHLAGAAIDVVEGETLLKREEEMDVVLGRTNSRGTMRHSVEISILKAMPNVIISPHNAYNTVEAIQRINGTTTDNIIRFWHNDMPNLVKPPEKPPGKLVIIRHGESEWNATGQWTGITDVHLTEKGFKEAAKLGVALKELEITIDTAYCSEQIRTRETLEGILNASQQFEVDINVTSAINERDYGDYTGKNKWEVKEMLGEEAFNNLRRGWNVEVPNGETLKMVYERAVPFYRETILPLINKGQNVLLVAHGNSIRALMKYIEEINDDEVSHLEMLFGQIVIYEVDENGHRKNSSITEIDTEKSPNA